MHSPSAEVKGVDVDHESRCAHYHSQRDIIAIRLKCCGDFYACKDCHYELAGHNIQTWHPRGLEPEGSPLRSLHDRTDDQRIFSMREHLPFLPRRLQSWLP